MINSEFYYLSTKYMTVGVYVINNKITITPPIVIKFKGQDISNLVNWLSKQPGFKYEKW